MEDNEPIFNRIKDVLRNHEEPYNDGAWERFSAKQKTATPQKRAITMWKRSLAAAAVIAGIILLTRLFNGTDTPALNTEDSTPVAMTEPGSKDSTPIDQLQTHSTASTNNIVSPSNSSINNTINTPLEQHSAKTAAVTHKISTIKSSEKIFNTNNVTAVPLPPVSTHQPPASEGATVAANTDPGKPAVDFWRSKPVENTVKPGSAPSAKDEQKMLVINPPATIPDRKVAKEKNGRWQPSLFVSPIFDEGGVNMGYGVSVAYAINDKINISSGVAHTRLSASRSYDGRGATGSNDYAAAPNRPGPSGAAGPTGAAGSNGNAGLVKTATALLPTKSAAPNSQAYSWLQQVDGSLSGLDIPVSVNYNISNKLYASAGVSGLIVLKDNKKYTYTDNQNVKVLVLTSNDVVKEDKTVAFSDKSYLDQPLQATKENTPFLGFYNLSAGYRQKISAQNTISIEPFLKIPMQNVTQQSLKYTGTGIRLKFDF